MSPANRKRLTQDRKRKRETDADRETEKLKDKHRKRPRVLKTVSRGGGEKKPSTFATLKVVAKHQLPRTSITPEMIPETILY